jgi:hypothetical protein
MSGMPFFGMYRPNYVKEGLPKLQKKTKGALNKD